MRRLAAIALVLAAGAALLVVGTGAKGSGGDYKVRAIFDNAVSVISGEDVKVAGVKVGSVDSLDVTSDQKAAVVLAIDNPAFQDFRQDAHCTIRPQSLIGEKFVECEPTQARPDGAPEAPALQKVAKGQAGSGQYLLPLSHTSTPVDIDLIQNVLRRPYAQRFSIILNELGAGVAGRAGDLREVVRRADPALQQTDRVLQLLGRQNKVLSDLAKNSDTILAPLARDRRSISGFVTGAAKTAEATAERRTDLERNLQRLPGFLRELKPTAQRLGAFARQAGPVFTDLNHEAPDISRFLRALGPFSTAATPAIQTLGDATVPGTPAVKALRPIAGQLRTFSGAARPVGQNLAAILDSFQKTGGIERAMDYIFYQVTAINGFDAFGHYLRAALIVNLCSTYTTTPATGCSSNFTKRPGARAAASAGNAGDPALQRTAAVLRGATPAEAKAQYPDKPAAARALALPRVALPGQAPARSTRRRTSSPPASPGATSAQAGLFNYLFGPDK
jgi:virulence factor Mce-like protein